MEINFNVNQVVILYGSRSHACSLVMDQ